MQERRKVVRTSVLRSAKLVTEQPVAVDCVVADLTNAGAGLQVPDALRLPEYFGLSFDAGYSMRACRLIWRRDDRAGVKFI